MTFFLQVTPPEAHPWAGRTIAVFSCTRCFDETPNRFRGPGFGRVMAEIDRDGVDVDHDFIDGASGHMCLVAGLMRDVALRAEPAPHIPFRPLVIAEAAEAYYGLKIGDRPMLDPVLDAWMADVRFRGERVAFLFQVPARRTFPRLSTAPLRADYLLPPDRPNSADPEQTYYELGNGGVVFAFGSAVGPADGYLVAGNPIAGR